MKALIWISAIVAISWMAYNKETRGDVPTQTLKTIIFDQGEINERTYLPLQIKPLGYDYKKPYGFLGRTKNQGC